jgi:hypothetical protein
LRAYEVVVAAALIVIALAAIDLAKQVRAVRMILERLRGREFDKNRPIPLSHGTGVPYWPGPLVEAQVGKETAVPIGGLVEEVECGYCVWSYRNGAWQVELNHCHAGYTPAAPDRPGDYEGHCVRTACRRDA